ncbi:MAG: MmgE/PrpD family protein [Proteobacteria bacterium]|nr:MmgE/PrpD family protein [Pseudomonadota bacterium]
MSDERLRSEEGVRALAAWAAGVGFEDLPEAVVRRTALLVVDDIAAMIAARDEPELRALVERLLAASGPAEATIFLGGRRRADRASAALANGFAATWCELDEGNRRSVCHGGLYALPAAIAEAEATGLPTAEVLRAVAVGYEVAVRFTRAFRFPSLPVHPHAAYGGIGAAAAVAAARRLDAKSFLDALTNASALVIAGPFNHVVEGAMIENAWPGVAAWLGFKCADWAACGLSGLLSSPYDTYARVLGAATEPERLGEGLGRDWAVADGYNKLYGCCGFALPIVEAVLPLVRGLPPRRTAAEIEGVVVESHRLGLALSERAPRTTLGARFSLPHIVAAACVYGHAGGEAFSRASLADPEVVRLRERVELRPFAPEMPWPNDRPARVRLVFRDGTAVVGECLSAPGGPDNPYPAEVVLEKARGLAGAVYPGYAGVAARLVALEEGLVRRPWAELVGELVRPA